MEDEIMQEDWLDEEKLQFSQQRKKPKRTTRNHASGSSTDDSKYALSFSKFLENRHKDVPNVTEEIDEPPVHTSVPSVEVEMVDNIENDDNIDDDYAEEETKENQDPSAHGNGKDHRTVDPKTGLRAHSKGVKELYAMTEKDLLILSIMENRATYRRFYNMRQDFQKLNLKVDRIDKTLLEQNSDGVDKICWPVANKTSLASIEDSLRQQKSRTIKLLKRQFKRADTSSLYKFLRSNLTGLLHGSGRYTWTGNPPHNVPPKKGPLTEKQPSEKPSDSNEPTTVEPTEAANTLLSVQLLQEICGEIFHGKTDSDIEKEFIHVLKNINAADHKRLKTKMGDKLNSTV